MEKKIKEKVVVLRELQRAIIYTSTLSKQAIEGHVSTAFIAYSVNGGARLTNDSVCCTTVTFLLNEASLCSITFTFLT